jgi:hypothetical protein
MQSEIRDLKCRVELQNITIHCLELKIDGLIDDMEYQSLKRGAQTLEYYPWMFTPNFQPDSVNLNRIIKNLNYEKN